MKLLTKHRLGSALVVLWLAAAGGGYAALCRYQAIPGEAATAATDWPSDSPILPTPGLSTLVMTVHPHCACSRASLSELAVLMARTHRHLSAHVLFVQPHGASEAWVTSDLWRTAEAIPGVTVIADPLGAQTQRLGAATSGHVFLYDIQGTLVFDGGITAARGHAGDNTGRSAIEALILRHQVSTAQTPVFGCALSAP